QVGPRDKGHPAVGVVAHVRIVAWSLAAVKIYRVRPPAQSLHAVPILLAVGHARVLGLQAVEPAALICGVKDASRNQCLDPDGEIAGGGDDAPREISKRGVQVRVVSGRSVPARAAAWMSGGYGVSVRTNKELPYK